MSELAMQKSDGLDRARKVFAETGRTMLISIDVREGSVWRHYLYEYDPSLDKLIQDVTHE